MIRRRVYMVRQGLKKEDGTVDIPTIKVEKVTGYKINTETVNYPIVLWYRKDHRGMFVVTEKESMCKVSEHKDKQIAIETAISKCNKHTINEFKQQVKNNIKLYGNKPTEKKKNPYITYKKGLFN